MTGARSGSIHHRLAPSSRPHRREPRRAARRRGSRPTRGRGCARRRRPRARDRGRRRWSRCRPRAMLAVDSQPRRPAPRSRRRRRAPRRRAPAAARAGPRSSASKRSVMRTQPTSRRDQATASPGPPRTNSVDPPPTSTIDEAAGSRGRPATTPAKRRLRLLLAGEEPRGSKPVLAPACEEPVAVRGVADGAGGHREAPSPRRAHRRSRVAAHDVQRAPIGSSPQPPVAVDALAEARDLRGSAPPPTSASESVDVGHQEPRRVRAHVDHRDAHQRGSRTSRTSVAGGLGQQPERGARPARGSTEARRARPAARPCAQAACSARRQRGGARLGRARQGLGRVVCLTAVSPPAGDRARRRPTRPRPMASASTRPPRPGRARGRHCAEPRGRLPVVRSAAVRYSPRHGAGWSSPVARRAHNPKVAGSNPAPATPKGRTRRGALSAWLRRLCASLVAPSSYGVRRVGS